MRAQPMLVVNDVEASSRLYRGLLGCESAHGGPHDEELMANDRLVLHLHAGTSIITIAPLPIATSLLATACCCGRFVAHDDVPVVGGERLRQAQDERARVRGLAEDDGASCQRARGAGGA